ncbi:hypothetical protein M2161_001657 [Streptomyces sp. SAI-133]|nr:hypothetical protein [Streptomyces sp. SAI-133]
MRERAHLTCPEERGSTREAPTASPAGFTPSHPRSRPLHALLRRPVRLFGWYTRLATQLTPRRERVHTGQRHRPRRRRTRSARRSPVHQPQHHCGPTARHHHQVRTPDAGHQLALAAAHAAVGGRQGRHLPGQPAPPAPGRPGQGAVRAERRRRHPGHPPDAHRTARPARLLRHRRAQGDRFPLPDPAHPRRPGPGRGRAAGHGGLPRGARPLHPLRRGQVRRGGDRRRRHRRRPDGRRGHRPARPAVAELGAGGDRGHRAGPALVRGHRVHRAGAVPRGPPGGLRAPAEPADEPQGRGRRPRPGRPRRGTDDQRRLRRLRTLPARVRVVPDPDRAAGSTPGSPTSTTTRWTRPSSNCA